MPPKIPPRFRKFESGYEKRKKKKKLEEFIQSQRGALDKFLIKKPQVSIENENVGNVDVEILENVVTNDENDNMENGSGHPENGGDVNGADVHLNNSLDNGDDNLEDNVNDDGEQANHSIDIFDPRNWDALDSKMIDLLVTEGPKRDLSIVGGPKDKSSRCFTTNLYTRILANGEKWDRNWLVYSKELDRVFCFCCKVFKKGIGKGQLTNEGFCNWKHVGERLREHERGTEHIKNMVTWSELRQRLQKNQTIVNGDEDDVNLNNSLDNEDDNLEDNVNDNGEQANRFEHSVDMEDNVNDNGEQANRFEHSVDIFDPRNWDALDSKMIDLLVTEGPNRDLSIVSGPKDKSNRRFTAHLYTRTLANGEKWDRNWLVYSKELDRVFCFCCKVFKKGIGKGQLTNEGFCNWKHVSERLKEHERGTEHIRNMVTWSELRQRLEKNRTIDKTI